MAWWGVIFVLLAIPLQAEEVASWWAWQHPSPQGNTLQGVVLLEEGGAVAVGQNGTIVRRRPGS
ncbi:MAG: hypothetical protein ACO394_10895, partial [Blastocatellia bacterium]